MQEQAQLPVGFISVQDAIDLINSDTRSEAKVDTQFLLNNIPYLRRDANYNIRKLKTVETKRGREHVADGCVYVRISNDFEKESLKHAIVEHYKAMAHRDIDPDYIGIDKFTSEVNSNGGDGHIRDNSDTTLEESITFGGDTGRGLVN